MSARKFWVSLIFIVVPLTILALLLITWSARLQLAEYSMTSVMHDAGLNNVITDISQLDINESTINRLEFSLPTKTGLLHLKAVDANIQYQPAQLLHGKVDRLVIGKLMLHYQTTEINQQEKNEQLNETAQALQPLELIAALRHALTEYLFFNTLELQQVTLNGAPFSVLQDKTFQLKSARDNTSLQAEISMLAPAAGEQVAGFPQLIINKLSAESLSLALMLSEAPATVSTTAVSTTTVSSASGTVTTIPAKLELNILDKTITGNYQLNLQRLQVWLQPFVSIQSMDKMKSLNGTLSFDFSTDEQINSIITAGTDKLDYETFRAQDLAVKIKLKNTTSSPVSHTKISNGSYIQASNISIDKLSLKNNRIYFVGELSRKDENWLYNGGLSWKLVTANFKSQEIQLKDIAARISASADNLDLDGDFSTASVAGKFSFILQHKLKDKLGTLSIKPLKPLNFNDEDSSLSLLLSPWPYPFDVLSGKIKLSSEAAWSQQDKLRFSTKIKFEDVGGNVSEQLFSGLSFDHELELLPKLQSKHGSVIKLALLDSGVISSNISSKLAIKTADSGALPLIVMQDLYGEIFGGTFSGDNLHYDLNRSKNKFNIKASNIDLAEIVKTQQLNDITATGRIDGIIPVEINQDGLFIEDGAFLNHVRNGTIRYNPKAGTDLLQQNPLTGIALDALKDFHYSHLSAGVNFTPDGTLSVNLQLKGTSPELDTNRPVHLNINTEQNLLSLLKSLRYAQGVSENIDNKVCRQYEKNQ